MYDVPKQSDGLSATWRRFQVNLDRLLDIENAAQRSCRSSRDALVHAGKMATVGRMVAGVNHEIKRPLASIRLLGECCLDQLSRGESERLQDNLQRMLRIVDQAAMLSRRLEGFSRKEAPRLETLDVAAVLSDTLAVLAPQLQASGCRVLVSCDGWRALGDPDRLTFVLVNLIDNAICATADRREREIDVRAVRAEQHVVISVRDRGPGLSPEVLSHLFEEFFTTKPLDKGLGLGLAIAADMVREMGGEIIGGNHPEGGAEFSVRLGRA